jgi:hypothetical protein
LAAAQGAGAWASDELEAGLDKVEVATARTAPGTAPEPDLAPGTHEAEMYFSYVCTTPYAREAVAEAVKLGNALLQAAGGWKPAAQAIRAWWSANKDDHFAGLFDEKLDGLLDHLLLAQLRKTATQGVDPKCHGEVGERVKSKPHPSLRGHLEGHWGRSGMTLPRGVFFSARKCRMSCSKGWCRCPLPRCRSTCQTAR